MRILTGLALVLLGLTLPASAIELSLEQNKAERGSIGFIDMQRLFQEFPETIQAKEDFKGLVQQAEEQLNLKKTEVLRLRNDLAQLRQQRDSLANAPVPAQAPIPAAVKPENPAASKPAPQTALRTEPQPTPKPPAPVASPIAAPPPAPAKPASLAIAPQTQEVETDLTRPLLADMPGFAVTAAPTTAAPSQPVQTAPVAVQPAAPKPPPPPRSVAISTAPAPAAAPAAMPPSGPTPAQLDA
ncbi:MAG: OmpH family outer membrane protein, partial [Elusimicrobia bacterium]|nr:OmpH family outer membrane protein [Elusimicrobiota bacterium]